MTRTLSVRVPDEIYNAIKEVAKEHGTTISAVLEACLTQGIKEGMTDSDRMKCWFRERECSDQCVAFNRKVDWDLPSVKKSAYLRCILLSIGRGIEHGLDNISSSLDSIFGEDEE